MEKQTTTVTVSELVEVLKTIEIGTFANIQYRINVRMNKTGNPYHDKVFKHYKGNIYTGSNYMERVKNNLIKEGKINEANAIEAKPSNVGTHVSKCVLYNAKHDKYYLQYEWFEEIKPQVEYTFEGDNIGRELFQQFEVKKSYGSSTQADLERKVNTQTVTVDNIIAISLNGIRYLNEAHVEAHVEA
jgi:hypothetical protein